jgi:uncharacterized protein (TIGR00251 family)
VKGALQAVDGGVLLDVSVTPGAEEDRFPHGYNEWRERVGARVRADAEDGQANRALCQLVADQLGVSPDRVGIRRGHTNARKTLIVTGTDVDAVRAALGEARA